MKKRAESSFNVSRTLTLKLKTIISVGKPIYDYAESEALLMKFHVKFKKIWNDNYEWFNEQF